MRLRVVKGYMEGVNLWRKRTFKQALLFVFILGCATTRPTTQDNARKYEKMVAEYKSAVVDYDDSLKKDKEFEVLVKDRWNEFYRTLTNEQIDAFNLYKKYKNNESRMALMEKLSNEQKVEFVWLESFIQDLITGRKMMAERKRLLDDWRRTLEQFREGLLSSYARSDAKDELLLNFSNQLQNFGKQVRQNAGQPRFPYRPFP